MPRQVFDKDHSGAIDAEELQQLMFEFGMAVPESEVQAALRAIDADNSGEIDLDEFSVWWLCAPHPQIKETVTLKLLRTKLRLRQKLRNVKESFRSQRGSQRDMADVYVCVCRVDFRHRPVTNCVVWSLQCQCCTHGESENEGSCSVEASTEPRYSR